MISLNTKSLESVLLTEPHIAVMFSFRTLTDSVKVSSRTLQIVEPKALNLEKGYLAELWSVGSFRKCPRKILQVRSTPKLPSVTQLLHALSLVWIMNCTQKHVMLHKIQRAENGGSVMVGFRVFGEAPICRPEVPKLFKRSILGPLGWKSGCPKNAKSIHGGSNPQSPPSENYTCITQICFGNSFSCA